MTATQTATSTWVIDPVHTGVEFSVKHMGFSTFRGRFKTVEGTILLDEVEPVNSSTQVSIQAKSIDITPEQFYGHIVGPQFLDIEQYPALTFKSTGVEQVDGGRWQVSGDLTIRDCTRPVVLAAEYLGQDRHPFSKKLIGGFLASTRINRKDFGLAWNALLDSGAAYVGEEVTITLNIEAVRQE